MNRNKTQNYTEADLILLFGLNRLVGNQAHPLMTEWLDCKAELNDSEHYLFNLIWKDAQKKIDGWHEEDLKMKFICFVLLLGHLEDNGQYNTYFERTVQATVEGHFLKTKTDFMIAKGVFDTPQLPYFHLQEWKPRKKPYRDSMVQLLEALLITQELNQHQIPIYGCEVMGKHWSFVILEGKNYFISQSCDCTKQNDLLQIIAILRKFKQILATRLLNVMEKEK
jgi:hypothetical protein